MNRLTRVALPAVVASLALAGCAAPAATPAATPSSTAATASTVTIEDNNGQHTIAVPPARVVALDNASFGLLDDWDVELVAGARALMSPEVDYKEDESIVDTGNHREPNLEAIVAAQPDLIIGGGRYASHMEKIGQLVPDVPALDLTPRDGEDFGAELKRKVTTLGTVFGKEAEAAEDVKEFDEAVARVKAAYDPSQKVMAVITSGGNVNYAAPGSGRTLGPVFDMAGLTPALEVKDASSDHQGDDISVEAIAAANPDWILVMDRDAATSANSGETYTPANELIANSAALQNVTAVKDDRIVYMPQYTYLDEGLATYTEFLEDFADALEKQ
ncbi:MAG: ABC transporter substrate-binding protein [Propionibacteriaceae bacterium]|nr:ABC transporter substrate-binding protein [Propionibacteriaceae bacterium]